MSEMTFALRRVVFDGRILINGEYFTGMVSNDDRIEFIQGRTIGVRIVLVNKKAFIVPWHKVSYAEEKEGRIE